MVRPAHFRKTRRRSTIRAFWWSLPVALLVAGWVLLGERLASPEPVKEVDLAFGLCGEKWGACVVDGDTVRIGQRRIRLTGFDAPEMEGACDAESAKARLARDELRRWLAIGPFQWTGGSAPPRDQYGRELREARRGDELLAEHMVSAGLAEGSGWGARPQAWC